MNMFKKNGGFTLVELIVVIAILAILAGVAIPAYSGYITKAKDAAVITELDAIATAAQAANAKVGAVTSITVSSTGEITIDPTTNTAAGNDFYLYYGKSAMDATKMAGTSYANGAVWSNGTWTPAAGNQGTPAPTDPTPTETPEGTT